MPEVNVGSPDKRMSSVYIEMNNSTEFSYGLWAYRGKDGTIGGRINIFADTLTIKTYSAVGNAYGMYTSTTNASTSSLPSLNISAGKTVIDVNSGLGSTEADALAVVHGAVDIDGDLYINTAGGNGNAILARDDAQVNINRSGTGTVQMNGDIRFDYAGQTGVGVDSVVNVNLTNADSY